MIAGCPKCGRPCTIVVGAPGIACPACGHQGPFPAEIQQHVEAAAALLARSQLSQRQLTAAQRRAIVSSGASTAILAAILGLSILPGACVTAVFGLAISDQDHPVEGMAVAFTLSPLVPALLAAGVSFAWFRRRRRNLEDACAAQAPSTPGEPFGCRVCGAPLHQEPDAVVRCRHCQADNLVAPAAVARAAAIRARGMAGMESEIARELASLDRAASGLGIGAIVGSLVVPIASVVLCLAIVIGLQFIELAPDPKVEYVLHDDCIAQVFVSKSGEKKIEPDTGKYEPLDPKATILHHGDLVGREVHAGGTFPVSGKITRFYSTPVETNRLELRQPNGELYTRSPMGLCMGPPQ